MRAIPLSAFALSITFAGPQAVLAQRPAATPAPATPAPATLSGSALWFSATAGRGFARVDCDICRGARTPSTTASLRLGGRVKPRLLVGLEATGWLNSENDVDEHIWVLSGVTQYYLRAVPRAFVKGGIAAIAYHIEDTQETLSSNSLGLQAGLGYDLPVATRLYLTGSLMLTHGVFGGGLKFNGAELDERAHTTLLQLGLGVTRK